MIIRVVFYTSSQRSTTKLLARRTIDQEVSGSNPATCTRIIQKSVIRVTWIGTLHITPFHPLHPTLTHFIRSTNFIKCLVFCLSLRRLRSHLVMGNILKIIAQGDITRWLHVSLIQLKHPQSKVSDPMTSCDFYRDMNSKIWIILYRSCDEFLKWFIVTFQTISEKNETLYF